MRISKIHCIVMSLVASLVLSMSVGATAANAEEKPVAKQEKKAKEKPGKAKAREGKAKKEKPNREEALKKQFAKKDTDQSGTVSLAEFTVAAGKVTGTDFEEGEAGPGSFGLDPPYPNPANGRTTMTFELPDHGRTSLRVYDLQGRHVASIVDDWRPAGRHTVTWEGRGSDGKPLVTGFYFVRLNAAGQSAARGLVLDRP